MMVIRFVSIIIINVTITIVIFTIVIVCCLFCFLADMTSKFILAALEILRRWYVLHHMWTLHLSPITPLSAYGTFFVLNGNNMPTTGRHSSPYQHHARKYFVVCDRDSSSFSCIIIIVIHLCFARSFCGLLCLPCNTIMPFTCLLNSLFSS